MIDVPGLRGLEVGLTSRNEPTLGGRRIMSPVMLAEAEPDGLSVLFRLFDVFGLACGGVRPVRGMVLDGDALASAAPALTATEGSLAQSGASFVALTSDGGRLGLTAAAACEVALWLPNDLLVRSGALVEPG